MRWSWRRRKRGKGGGVGSRKKEKKLKRPAVVCIYKQKRDSSTNKSNRLSARYNY